MCFKPPKPPKVADPTADPELYRQRAEAERDLGERRAANKQAQTEQQLAILAGRIGRKSLFSGGQGGAGFGSLMGRSLFGDAASSSYSPGQRYSFFDAPASVQLAPPPAPVSTGMPEVLTAMSGSGSMVRSFLSPKEAV
jgi:hypothetical protein